MTSYMQMGLKCLHHEHVEKLRYVGEHSQIYYTFDKRWGVIILFHLYFHGWKFTDMIRGSL